MACAVARRRQGKETNEKRTARNNYCSSMREGRRRGFLVDGWAKGAKERKRKRERERYLPRKGNSRGRAWNGRGKDQRGAFPLKVVKTREDGNRGGGEFGWRGACEFFMEKGVKPGRGSEGGLLAVPVEMSESGRYLTLGWSVSRMKSASFGAGN